MEAAHRVKHYREVCMPTPRSPVIALMLTLLLLVAGFTPCLCTAQAQQLTFTAPAANKVTRGPTDPAELASFLNTTITYQLTNGHIAGATVAVVKDGKLFYTKGYGYADVENKTPVDANVSMFEIGSTTKLFTWTAVMQLVEEGKIDLHADVNTYLKDFKIPATYPQPITMENLMTHTAGFEEQPKGLAVSDPKDIQPLGTVLAQTIPTRLWPPGQVWSYSNWGAALAGYIVEEASGMPFDQYVKENIFTPLGMNNTTIEQPAPPQLAPNIAKTYVYNNSVGAFEQKRDLVIQLAPAGAIYSTAPDMANFMIAHLNNGTYNNTRILNTSTAQDMHRAHFTPDPYTKFGLGFFIDTQNNESSISHDGDTYYFHTMCMLWPERNIGLFVSYNSLIGALAMYDLKQKFLDHYYPYTPVPPQPANSNDAPRLSGTYQNTRSRNIVDVVGYPNGTLQITSPAAPNRSVDLVEVAPLVFANPSGNITSTFSPLYHYIFTTGSNGTYFHGDAIPQYFERLPSTPPPPGSRTSDTSDLPFSSQSPSDSQHFAYPMAPLAAWYNPRLNNSSSTPPPSLLSPTEARASLRSSIGSSSSHTPWCSFLAMREYKHYSPTRFVLP
ncbi:MAG TPA: serine hydrolase domain-containing protein [Candidatus Acidoferrales bacterium]|nr:serine hydrolase domain-containing protein [Candidatus Acidoferrales bacterium]